MCVRDTEYIVCTWIQHGWMHARAALWASPRLSPVEVSIFLSMSTSDGLVEQGPAPESTGYFRVLGAPPDGAGSHGRFSAIPTSAGAACWQNPIQAPLRNPWGSLGRAPVSNAPGSVGGRPGTGQVAQLGSGSTGSHRHGCVVAARCPPSPDPESQSQFIYGAIMGPPSIQLAGRARGACPLLALPVPLL